MVLLGHTRGGLRIPLDGCEPPCGCWELNSGSLEEEPVLLTPEPSLQPKNENDIFKDVFIKINEFPVAVFRHQKKKKLRSYQTTVLTAVSHQAVAGI